LRFMNVYGPRQNPESGYSGVISIFLDRALAGRPITIYGDGEQTRDFVHARDAAKAVTAALRNGASDQVVINVGTGRETSINQLARTILELTRSKSAIDYAAARPGDVRYSVTTLERARSALGFEPQVDLREGLAETLDWLTRQQRSPEKVV